MMKQRKPIAFMLAGTLLFSGISPANAVMAAETEGTEKQYIIATTESEEVEKIVSDDSIEQVTKLDGTEIPDIVVASLTNQEVREIKNNDATIAIEEDVILSGSMAETEGEDGVLPGSTTETEDGILPENTVEKTKELPKTEDMNQWYLDAIGVENREASTGKVKVALLDSGVAFSQDIDVADSVDFVDEGECNPLFLDASGHGTAIAGVLCAKDNGKGITGVNPDIELYSAKVLDDENKAPLSRIIEGIYWGIEHDVDIMNMSFGTTVNSNILHKAIKDAYDNGILLVGAAGNSSHREVQYPAAYAEVIAVGSTSPEGKIADETSVGTELELLAPGEKIMATSRLDYHEVVGGTSIATAQVTGVASLLLQKDVTKSKEFIRDLLRTSSKTVETEGTQTAGLVDYEYAKDIYDEFEANYAALGEAQPELENEAQPEEYTEEAEGLVEGLWGTTKHGEMLNNIGQGSLSTHQFNIIIKAAKDADIKDRPEAAELHGAANYVANLKYLWYLSVFLERDSTGTSPTSMAEVNSKIASAKALANEKLAGTAAVDNNAYENLRDNTSTLLKYGYESEDYLSSRKLKLIACGYAIHLLADIYSHRTLVPANTPINYSNTVVADQFMSSDFQNINAFYNDYSQGDLEFRLVKQYVRSGVDHNTVYIDNPDFYHNRYLNAEVNVDYFLQLMDDVDAFYYQMLMPDSYPTNSKLSRLKEFVSDAGCNTSLYTTSEWNQYSN